MKLLVISTVNYGHNGIAMVIRNLYANEIFRKENVTFVFPAGSDKSMIEEQIGWGHKIRLSGTRLSKPFKYLKSLYKLMKEGQYELVHVHGNSGTCALELVAAKLAGIPVRIMHGHASSCKHVWLHRLLKPLMNMLCTDRFACSAYAGRFIYGKKPCTVIHNAFEVDKFRFDPKMRAHYRAHYNIDEDTTVIGHTGALCAVKNQMFLIRTFQHYHEMKPNSRLVLFGDGSDKARLSALIVELGLENAVIMTGNCRNVCEQLNALDIFAFPSISEGLGIAPIEAQANGLSVLSAMDNIPKDIQINDNFQFMSLNEGEKIWADRLLAMSIDREIDAAEKVRKAGYDILPEVRRLHEIYETRITEAKRSK